MDEACVRLMPDGTGEPSFSWNAEAEAENLMILFTLERDSQPPIRRRLTLTDWRNEE